MNCDCGCEATIGAALIGSDTAEQYIVERMVREFPSPDVKRVASSSMEFFRPQIIRSQQKRYHSVLPINTNEAYSCSTAMKRSFEVLENSEIPVDYVRRLTFIREETRFEIGLLHDRINALISAEAFLTISFTMAMSNSNALWGATFSTLVPPILSLLGLVLAILAWPGVDSSYKILVEWNVAQLALMRGNPHMTEVMWRVDALGNGSHRTNPDRGLSVLFARAVPTVFGIAWAALTIIALLLPLRRL